MRDLSIIIPSRNELFLKNTVDDILKNREADTEVIIVLDGEWGHEPIPDNKRVKVVYYPKSIGQRAAQNVAARLSSAKYLMKVDAHCAFDKGFDRKMLEAFEKLGDNVTMVPNMKNLHAFDWVCKECGHRRYQGPEGVCEKCGGERERDVVWFAKPSPNSTSYLFNCHLQFKYFGQYKPKQGKELGETMSLQGSCFMVTRKRYWDLNLCDESWGSWGQQGTEVAIKSWLSGGRVICNKTTWYAHMFRTQPGFRWPYPAPGRSQKHARETSRNVFYNNRWDKQVYPLSWLIEKFKPVPYWHERVGNEEPDTKILNMVMEKGKEFYNRKKKSISGTKGIIYYTDNQLNLKIAKTVQENLRKISKEKNIPITSCSLKRMDNMGKNVHLKNLKRGYLTMFRQQLAALEASDAEIVYFCEHDTLYHPSHFDFTPERRDTFYYNINVWKLNIEDGKALWVDVCRQVSGLCGYREELIKHYKERIKKVEEKGRFERNMGFEPGTHGRVKWENEYKCANFKSAYPNVDIRHDTNLTPNRWRKDQFRNQRWTEGWKFSDEIPGWGKNKEVFKDFLKKEALC